MSTGKTNETSETRETPEDSVDIAIFATGAGGAEIVALEVAEVVTEAILRGFRCLMRGLVSTQRSESRAACAVSTSHKRQPSCCLPMFHNSICQAPKHEQGSYVSDTETDWSMCTCSACT